MGRGFTEWANVTRARPLFGGHDQPRLPADLGFYDLRLPEARAAQAELARAYGIEGFCYWHYWFHGQRLLERPVNDILATGEPNFPFCLAWANESWSRSWLGDDREILIEQTYSEQDDRAHARWLAQAFADPRYIHVHGRPLLVIYKPKALPSSQRTTNLIREECLRLRLPNPYLVGIDAHCPGTDLRTLGFDMTEHHEPQLGALGANAFQDNPGFAKLKRNLRKGIPHAGYKIYSYAEATRRMATMRPSFSHFPCCFVGWDNTARRGKNAIVMVESSPRLFEEQLSQMVSGVMHKHPQERVVFINAWNEWAEGMYLEPDQKHGHQYLEVVRRVVENASSAFDADAGQGFQGSASEPIQTSHIRVHGATDSPQGIPRLASLYRQTSNPIGSEQHSYRVDGINRDVPENQNDLLEVEAQVTTSPMTARIYEPSITQSVDPNHLSCFRMLDSIEPERNLLLQENRNLMAQLADIRASRAFKLARKLNRVIMSLVPPGSRRRRLARNSYRGLRSLPRVGRRLHQQVTQQRDRDHAPQPDACQPLVRPQQPERRAKGCILVVDHQVPMLHSDAGSVRMSNILEILGGGGACGHQVTFFPNYPDTSAANLEAIQNMGVEVIQPPYDRDLRAYLKEYGSEYSLVILSRADIAAQHLSVVRYYAPQAKVVFDTVDLHFLREERQAKLSGSAEQTKRAERRRRQELTLVKLADLTLVVSPLEKAILEAQVPGCTIQVLPTIQGLTLRNCPGFDDRTDLLFIGGFDHPPNVDAVLHFVSKVFPHIQDKIPGIVFHVIGSNTPACIFDLAGPGIRVHGRIPDVEPLFDRCRLSVAPLRYGAGVKGKVNQSMALGVPVVATSIAAEGMHLEHEHNILIADEPEEFANEVVRLWNDPELWNNLVGNGYKNIQMHFSTAAAQAKIDQLLAWAGLNAGTQEEREANPNDRPSLAFIEPS